ncbi:DUF4142 domain-containing protein [Nonomuraea sp. MCN248]|uniref:DUF4142 domain-containing protein n=1 Tax=Nonomuraea corallina TaxID=2989783 RepID=A0ABT4SG13_9ACTN|nr:DUF4142 domain-containing protein [Nonomuraea corallina]MDA0636156.1 DUF4142 domain-containing protein [Nonomuraea corallina]
MSVPRRSHLALLLAAAIVVTGCNGGGGSTSAGLASPAPSTAASPGTGTAAPVQPSEQDRMWLREIHQGNMAETQAGQLAESKGDAEEVKAIGAMLVKDHTQFDVEVVRTAEQLGVKLPTSTSGEQKEIMTALRDASRAEFDEEFVTAMRVAHVQAIAATKKEIQNGTSPQVKQLAQKALPALEQHLAEIEKIPGAGTPAPDSGAPESS